MKTLAFFALAASLHAQTADTIYYNAKFITVDGQFRVVTGLAVKGDRILAADDIAKLKPLAGPQTKHVDLKGRTVIPGLIDNHLHFLRDALRWRQQTRIDGITSRAKALDIIVVLDRDYLTVPADEIKDIRPVMTVVGGKVVAGNF